MPRTASGGTSSTPVGDRLDPHPGCTPSLFDIGSIPGEDGAHPDPAPRQAPKEANNDVSGLLQKPRTRLTAAKWPRQTKIPENNDRINLSYKI